ncbi:DUF3558 domain-containing protein [Amycolatopsis sp. cmx-4-68]|uniref:DUF3558 domain-containing protein n=1 Tax=Amycolatopsis sp. cmx-4-68 TaxID=2790938 RepID=UPI003978E74D
MRRGLPTVVTLTAALVLAAACSTGDGISGTASSAPTTAGGVDPSSTAASALPYAGAPKVENPLPESVLSGDPCADALTPEQVKQAVGAVVEGKPDSSLAASVGLSCAWINHGTHGQIVVTYAGARKTGLSGVYENSQPKNPVWRPLADVHGFPGVAYSDNTDSDCTATVGLADDLSVDVSAVLSTAKEGKADSCDAAVQMAGLVVDTLKKRAGS